jgi:uncharacterized membrane protein YccC
VHREFNMGLATGLLICVVIALVLYWAVPLYWSFTRPWDHARSLKDPTDADSRSSAQPQNAPEQWLRRGVHGPSDTAQTSLGSAASAQGGRWLRDGKLTAPL